MTFPRRRFLSSSAILLGSTLLDALATPLWKWRRSALLEAATVIRRFDKTRFPPQGVAGGKPGGRARFVVRLGTADEHEPRASARYEMKAGERFLLQSAAGGGFGDPGMRERAAVERDLAEGYVTAVATKEDCGDGQ